jgi:hypothetical protein
MPMAGLQLVCSASKAAVKASVCGLDTEGVVAMCASG